MCSGSGATDIISDGHATLLLSGKYTLLLETFEVGEQSYTANLTRKCG